MPGRLRACPSCGRLGPVHATFRREVKGAPPFAVAELVERVRCPYCRLPVSQRDAFEAVERAEAAAARAPDDRAATTALRDARYRLDCLQHPSRHGSGR